jgi:hypothetical protein
MNQDLLVFDPASKCYYQLADFSNRQDKQTRDAEIIASSNSTLWSAENGEYWLFVEGNAIRGASGFWIGEDCLVFDVISKHYFALTNYHKKQDKQFREALIMISLSSSELSEKSAIN